MTATNQLIADRLREAADLLEQQAANPFRVRAYREAAQTVAGLERGLDEIHEREGIEGLDALPGVGPRIAAAIVEMLRTGRWSQLDRLRGSLDAERLFRAIPGVGAALARRIHEALHVDTLPALEVAAHDGRLAAVPGIGPRRAAALRAALAGMLGRTRLRPREPVEEPPVAMLLDVDREYREAAAAGRLPRITPRRFNPGGLAWLPVLHTERDHWQFTVVFSNTARAHELGKTHDWVVVYFHPDRHVEGQRTVVTETWGRLAGRRVVRGRESECRVAYGIPESSQGAPSASRVNRKKAPKAPPSAQNAGRLT
ncbi:MAG TPA: helix-hairpin-helix domain-containing protein [Methylomirabilota bacterium]